MSSPEMETFSDTVEEIKTETSVKEEKKEPELSAGVKIVSEGLFYIMMAPLNLVKSISMSLITTKRENLHSLKMFVFGFHIFFMVSDFFVMAFNRKFDLVSGSPSIIVKAFSLFLSYIIFQFIEDRLYTVTSKSLDKMDIKIVDERPVIVPVEVKSPVEVEDIISSTSRESVEVPSFNDEELIPFAAPSTEELPINPFSYSNDDEAMPFDLSTISPKNEGTVQRGASVSEKDDNMNKNDFNEEEFIRNLLYRE